MQTSDSRPLRATVALTAGWLLAISATADDAPPSGLELLALLAAGGLECAFDEPAAGNAFEIRYDEIALRSGTAAGGDALLDGDVRVIPTNLGLHFYEFDSRGNLSIATVAGFMDDSGSYLAVLSRHHGRDGTLQPEQYAGRCSISDTDATRGLAPAEDETPQSNADATPAADATPIVAGASGD